MNLAFRMGQAASGRGLCDIESRALAAGPIRNTEIMESLLLMVHGFLTTNDDAFDAYFMINHSFIHRIRTIG